MARRHYQHAMTAAQRAAGIAKIHIGKDQVFMDDAAYRKMLADVAGVKSSTQLTDAGISKVIKHLQGLGAVFVAPKRAGKAPHNLNSKADKSKQLEKIGALLADMKLPWDYALGIAQHMYQKQKLEFCSSRELIGITTALVKKQQKQI